MVLGPGAVHRAIDHGAQRAAGPDRCVDVQDDQAEQRKRRDRMQHDAGAHDFHRQVPPGTPHQHARQREAQHGGNQQPEQQLLAAVVLVLLGHHMVLFGHQFRRFLEPLAVAGANDVEPPEADHHQHERQRHHHPYIGMENARPGSAAKQLHQRIEGRVEERQARQRQQHEGDCHQPVVGALAGGVALEVTGAAFHFASSSSSICCSSRCSLRSSSRSSSAGTSCGPLVT